MLLTVSGSPDDPFSTVESTLIPYGKPVRTENRNRPEYVLPVRLILVVSIQ